MINILQITAIWIICSVCLGEYIVYMNRNRKDYKFKPMEDRKYSYIIGGICYVVFMVFYLLSVYL